MNDAPAPQPDPAPPEHRYLRLADLRRLQHLPLAPRRHAEGRYTGRHRSPQRGHSLEFNDYRPYTPGDPLNDVDWKVYGRSDKLFIKRYEHQADMTLHLLVDASASMAYRGATPRPRARLTPFPPKSRPADQPTKYDHACRLAAALAFLAIRQQDKVAFALAQQGLQQFHPPRGSFRHLRSILRTMENQPLAHQANLPRALHHLARRSPRRGLLVLFSDLLEDRPALLQALAAFTRRGSQAVVFHIHHPDELHLPDIPSALFTDSETGQKIRTNPDDIRDNYRRHVRRSLNAWAAAFKTRGIDHHLVSTAVPYHQALQRYLTHRSASSL